MAEVMPISEKCQEAINAAVQGYPKRWAYGVCAFQVFNKATGEYVHGGTTGDACHNDINYMRKGQVAVNAHAARWADMNTDFMLWIARESPFAHGVLNRDNTDEILHHAGVIDHDLVGKGGVLWVCKAFRHLNEDLWKHKTWTQLREQGLNGLQSFIGADILNENGSPNWCGSHCCLFGYHDAAKLREAYDRMRTIDRIDNGQAFTVGGGYERIRRQDPGWGSLKGITVRKADGWGGFIDTVKAGSVKDYAAMLKEIFEGDPKNVQAKG